MSDNHIFSAVHSWTHLWKNSKVKWPNSAGKGQKCCWNTVVPLIKHYVVLKNWGRLKFESLGKPRLPIPHFRLPGQSPSRYARFFRRARTALSNQVSCKWRTSNLQKWSILFSALDCKSLLSDQQSVVHPSLKGAELLLWHCQCCCLSARQAEVRCEFSACAPGLAATWRDCSCCCWHVSRKSGCVRTNRTSRLQTKCCLSSVLGYILPRNHPKIQPPLNARATAN